MREIFRPFEVLPEDSFVLEWEFKNTDHPEWKTEGDSISGFRPGKDTGWDAQAPLEIVLQLTVADSGNNLGTILTNAAIYPGKIYVVLELISSMSIRRQVRQSVVSTIQNLTLNLNLPAGSAPSSVQCRFLLLVGGRIRFEQNSPALNFSGEGTELAIVRHTDQTRALWEWEINMEDPSFDLLDENLVIHVLDGHELSQDVISCSSPKTAAPFNHVQKMFWSEIIFHIFLRIRSSGNIDEVIALNTPEGMMPGSFTDAARCWFRKLEISDLNGCLEDPVRFKKLVMEKILG